MRSAYCCVMATVIRSNASQCVEGAPFFYFFFQKAIFSGLRTCYTRSPQASKKNGINSFLEVIFSFQVKFIMWRPQKLKKNSQLICFILGKRQINCYMSYISSFLGIYELDLWFSFMRYFHKFLTVNIFLWK